MYISPARRQLKSRMFQISCHSPDDNEAQRTRTAFFLSLGQPHGTVHRLNFGSLTVDVHYILPKTKSHLFQSAFNQLSY